MFKVKKVLSLVLSLVMICNQSGFAQTVAQLSPARFMGGTGGLDTEIFRPLHLRYLSYQPLSEEMKIFADKGDMGNLSGEEISSKTRKLLEYFFIAVALPDDKFWVNLRPDAPNRIIDASLEGTDIGKILLAADVQLKKDTALFTSPRTPEGKEYWSKLYKKAGELFGSEQVTIPTFTRPWIVPGEIILREAGGSLESGVASEEQSPSAYIYKATLKVMLEEDYLNVGAGSQLALQGRAGLEPAPTRWGQTTGQTDPRYKVLNAYSSELIRQKIVPKLNRAVNSARRYAQLRQVYFSLILARWFKRQSAEGRVQKAEKSSNRPTNQAGLTGLIDSGSLAGLTSKTAWSKMTYFQEYQQSFKEGEYKIREQVAATSAQTIRSYTSGGTDFISVSSAISGVNVSSATRQDMEIALGRQPTILGFNYGLGDSVLSALPTPQVVSSSAVRNPKDPAKTLGGSPRRLRSDFPGNAPESSGEFAKGALMLKRLQSEFIFPDELWALPLSSVMIKTGWNRGMIEQVLTYWNGLAQAKERSFEYIITSQKVNGNTVEVVAARKRDTQETGKFNLDSNSEPEAIKMAVTAYRSENGVISLDQLMEIVGRVIETMGFPATIADIANFSGLSRYEVIFGIEGINVNLGHPGEIAYRGVYLGKDGYLQLREFASEEEALNAQFPGAIRYMAEVLDALKNVAYPLTVEQVLDIFRQGMIADFYQHFLGGNKSVRQAGKIEAVKNYVEGRTDTLPVKLIAPAQAELEEFMSRLNSINVLAVIKTLLYFNWSQIQYNNDEPDGNGQKKQDGWKRIQYMVTPTGVIIAVYKLFEDSPEIQEVSPRLINAFSRLGLPVEVEDLVKDTGYNAQEISQFIGEINLRLQDRGKLSIQGGRVYFTNYQGYTFGLGHEAGVGASSSISRSVDLWPAARDKIVSAIADCQAQSVRLSTVAHDLGLTLSEIRGQLSRFAVEGLSISKEVIYAADRHDAWIIVSNNSRLPASEEVRRLSEFLAGKGFVPGVPLSLPVYLADITSLSPEGVNYAVDQMNNMAAYTSTGKTFWIEGGQLRYGNRPVAVKPQMRLTQDIPAAAVAGSSGVVPDFGGIDLTRSEFSVQPMGSFQGLKLSLPQLSSIEEVDVVNEAGEIARMADKGFMPSPERFKNLIANCYYQDVSASMRRELLACCIKVGLLEEKTGVETSDQTRQVMLLADAI